MEWLAAKLTELYRPWYDNGLPEELQFSEMPSSWGLIRGGMSRAAQLAVALGAPFGVFGVIGIGYARRASRAWRPRERLLMEDVSCAFHPIFERGRKGLPVPTIHVDRLVFVLDRYLNDIRSPWPREQLRESIERFIAECPRDTPEDAD